MIFSITSRSSDSNSATDILSTPERIADRRMSESFVTTLTFFLPFYVSADEVDASEYISALSVKAHFAQPGHRDYMGAILGLGIKREWLGDIWVSGEDATVFVLKSVERHIADGLDKVGRAGVKVSPARLEDIKAPERKVKKVSFSVKSMRFDAVLAGLFGLSRTQAARSGKKIVFTICSVNILVKDTQWMCFMRQEGMDSLRRGSCCSWARKSIFFRSTN